MNYEIDLKDAEMLLEIMVIIGKTTTKNIN